MSDRRCAKLHRARSHTGQRFANLVVVAILIAAARCCFAHDAFDAVQCDGDVRKALIGSKLQDERVALLEKTHAGIGLKNEGGEEISDSVFYQAWTICGGSYHLLERQGVVRDVLHADHSVRSPAYLGACEVDGSTTAYPVFAILEAGVPGDAEKTKHVSRSDSTSLQVSAAWRIDESSAQFIRIDAAGVMCPRNGISTADGGR